MGLAEDIRQALKIKPAQVKRRLVKFVRERVREAGASGVVLGLSGGIDSSTAGFLCAEALGGDKVLGVSMPEAGVTDPHDLADARKLANKLHIGFKIVDITPAVVGIRKNIGDFKPDVTLPSANIKPRVRMTILYYYANLLNRLVVGSSNRSEIRAGYFTKYGDGAADLAPLGCLYKTQVIQLARYLGVPKYVLQKPPSAGLWRGQTDEAELGLPYEKLDRIYVGLDLGFREADIAKAVGVKVKDVRWFKRREKRARHKLAGPEVPEL